MKAIIVILISTVFLLSCTHRSGGMLVIEDSIKNLGTIQPAEISHFYIRVDNSGKNEMQILGISSSCSCVGDSVTLPVHISGHRSLAIPFRYHAKNRTVGFIREKIFFHTTDDSVLHKAIVTAFIDSSHHAL